MWLCCESGACTRAVACRLRAVCRWSAVALLQREESSTRGVRDAFDLDSRSPHSVVEAREVERRRWKRRRCERRRMVSRQRVAFLDGTVDGEGPCRGWNLATYHTAQVPGCKAGGFGGRSVTHDGTCPGVRRRGEGLSRPEPGRRPQRAGEGPLGSVLSRDRPEVLAATLGAERELPRRKRRSSARGHPNGLVAQAMDVARMDASVSVQDAVEPVGVDGAQASAPTVAHASAWVRVFRSRVASTAQWLGRLRRWRQRCGGWGFTNRRCVRRLERTRMLEWRSLELNVPRDDGLGGWCGLWETTTCRSYRGRVVPSLRRMES